MAKRFKVTVTVEDDLPRAPESICTGRRPRNRSHYYVGRCVSYAINEITAVRKRLGIPT